MPVTDDLLKAISDLPSDYNAAVDLLDHNLRDGRGDKVAYIDARGRWTYRELSDRVDRVADLLRQYGVEQEQRVLLCLADTIDFPTIFLGAIKAGVIPVAVNTLFNSDTYAYQLKDCRARLAFISSDQAVKFDAIADQCSDLKAVIVSGEGADRPQLEPLLAASVPVSKAANTHRDEPAFWLYTSGSTGPPKGVIHCHSSLRLTADLFAKRIVGFRESDVVYSVAKLFFAYGLGNSLTFPLSVGATTVLLEGRPTPDICSEVLSANKVSVLCGSPTFFAGLLANERCPTAAQVPDLRIATSAGEALPIALAERFTERFDVEIVDGLGSTEMLHIFIAQRPGEIKLGVTGKPIPGYEARIIDDDDQVAGAGVIGELQVRGPTAAMCYWNNRPKSLKTFVGEWTRTGDKYQRDEAGYYRYSGRSDDMLKVSGIYVSPFDVEEALGRHPAVFEAAVVAWTGDDGLVKPKAFIVLANGAPAPDGDLEAALRALVKTCVAPHAYPRWIEFVDDLPKTTNGKIQRFKLKQDYHG